MDTQVHNTSPLTCAQHKNFVNMSEITQNQVTIYRNLSENSTKVIIITKRRNSQTHTSL